MPSNRIRLKDLELVRHIAQAGSVTGAAALSNVSQPAASQRLLTLQNRLDATLFSRETGVMRPTQEGELLVTAANAIHRQLEQVAEDLANCHRQRVTRLRVATQCYTVYRWLPLVIRSLLAEFPDLEVDVIPEATDRTADAINCDELDVALVNRPPPCSASATALFEDEMFAVVSRSHPLASCTIIEPDQFVDQTLLLYTGEKHAVVEEVLKPAGVAVPRVVQIRITEAIVELARAGKGIAVLAGWVINDLPESDQLVRLRITRGGFLRRWYAITNPAAPPEYVDAFMHSVKGIGNSLQMPDWRARMA